MIAANRLTPVGWSPMPGKERGGGASGEARTRSMSPVRAHSAVASNPPLAASSPCSPYAVTDA